MMKKKVASVLLIFLSVIGLLLNVLNIKIFSHKSMRKISTFQYIFYLTLIDILILITNGVESILSMGFLINLKHLSNVTCKLSTFLSNYLFQFNICILLVINIDRAFVLSKKKPQQAVVQSPSPISNQNQNRLLKLTRFKKVISLIGIILLLANIHYLIFLNLNQISHKISNSNSSNFSLKFNTKWPKLLKQSWYGGNETIEKDKKTGKYILKELFFLKANTTNKTPESICECYPKDNSNYQYFLDNIWFWYHFLFWSFVPYLIMIISCLIIFGQIKKNRTLTLSTVKRNKKLLLIILLLNLYFIVCSFLTHFNNFYYTKSKFYYETQSFQTWSTIFLYTRFSLSFLIYIFISKKYRKILKNMIFKGNKPNRYNNTSQIILRNLNYNPTTTQRSTNIKRSTLV